tara:strand:+ start:189 stop:935 length:747 start_codon:yes stop_codon:yes gene_type:complete
MINFFKIYDNALSDEFCDKVIDSFENLTDLASPGVIAGASGSGTKIKNEVKNTIELDINEKLYSLNKESNEFTIIKDICNQMSEYTTEYVIKYLYDDNIIEDKSWDDFIDYLSNRNDVFENRNIPLSTLLPSIESLQDSGFRIKKYLKNNGYYNYHSDPAWAEMRLDKYDWRIPAGKYLCNARFLSVIMYFNTVEEGGETVFPTIPIDIKPKKGRLAVFPTHWTYLHKAAMPISCDKYSMNTFISIVV